MADVVLKDRDGTPTTYENVEQIVVATPDGGEATFVGEGIIDALLSSKIVKKGESVLPDEADGKIPSMARMEESVDDAKRSIPPIYKKSVDIEWDGSTTGRVKASGSYVRVLESGSLYMGNMPLEYYKIYDEPVISKSTLTGTGKAYADQSPLPLYLDFDEHIKGEFEFAKASDEVYTCYKEESIPILFSIFEEGAVYSSEYGTLTFPDKGLYAIKAQNANARFVSLSSDGAVYYDPDDMPDTVMEVVSHKVTEIDENSNDKQYPSAKAVWKALSSKIDLTKYYTRPQIDEKLMRISLNSQSDMDVNDDADGSYVKNRTHYDSRNSLTYNVPQTEDANAIDYKGFKWTKLSGKPIFTTDLTAIALMYENDPEAFEKYVLKLSDDVRISVEKNTTTYKLELNAVSFLVAAFAELAQGHNMSAFAYITKAEPNEEGSWEQVDIDDNITFKAWILCVREDSKLTYNDDGTIATMDGGTYIYWDDDDSGFSGAKVTINAGSLKKLDNKYIDFSNYYTKNEVAQQIAAILPAFSSDDNGKVLGIKDGKLAWIEMQTAASDELHITQAHSVVESDGELWIDGDNRTVPIDRAYEAIADGNELKLI